MSSASLGVECCISMVVVMGMVCGCGSAVGYCVGSMCKKPPRLISLGCIIHKLAFLKDTLLLSKLIMVLKADLDDSTSHIDP